MLNFITATPGSGKTLYLINKLKDIKDRKIYYHGIPDLKLDWTEIKDVQNYPDEIQDGSIVVIDEVSDHFPVRSAKDKPPLGIEFIRKHRHRGIDLYFITQHPSLLDHAARRLVGNHVHLQRNFGMERAVMYENNKLMDTQNWHDLQAAEKTQFKYPKECYGLYKSAEVHTVKRKLPKKLLLLIPLLAMVFGGIYSGYQTLFSDDALQERIGGSVSDSADPNASSFVPSFKPQGKDKHINWHTDLTPAIKGLPYTAPIYQKIAKVSALPKVSGCISQGNDCKCYTQQATLIDMSVSMCLSFLDNRPFDPFKKPHRIEKTKRKIKPRLQNS